MKKNLKYLLALCLTIALVFYRRAQGPYGHGPCEADEGQRKRRNDWQ